MKQEYLVKQKQIEMEIDKLYKSLEYEDNTVQFKAILSQIHELAEQKACLDDRIFYDENVIVTADEEISLVAGSGLTSHVRQYYIFENATCRKVGKIDYRDLESDYLGNIGYSIFPNYQGHHYAEKALSLLLSHLEKNNVEQVVINTYDNNIASIKTIERNGGVRIPSKYHNVVSYLCDTNYKKGKKERI